VKAISLWQPWASLLVCGAKRVETRGWPIKYRGPLAVHATKRWDGELAALCETEPFLSALLANVADSESWRPADLPRGAVVGRVYVADCFPAECVIRDAIDDGPEVLGGDAALVRKLVIGSTEHAFGDYTAGRFAWLTHSPLRLEEPVPWAGCLGLFDVPDELVPVLLT